MRKTIIDQTTGNVVNIIVLVDDVVWTPPTGQAIGADGGEIGQRWNGSTYDWINPPTAEPEG